MGRIKYHISKSFLIDKYWDKRMSLKQIADIINCNATTILDLMKKYKIKRRTLSEAETGKYNHAYIDGRTNNYCIDCGVKIHWLAKRCEICFGLYYNGIDHHAYIHGKGYEPYSFKFTLKLKKQIRNRDNFTCQVCGMTEKEHLIDYGTILDVHHIDYDKENCKKENLISLCHKCNMRANKIRNYWYAYFTYIINEIIMEV